MRHDYPPKPTKNGRVNDYRRVIRQALLRNRIGGSGTLRSASTTQGTFHEADEVDAGSSNLKAFTIVSVQGDYLETEEGPDVAKPYPFRQSPFGGFTFPDANRRSATETAPNLQEVPYTEEITPLYAPGDVIIAANIGSAAVGQVDGAEPRWEDVNAVGRHWDFPKQTVMVCKRLNSTTTKLYWMVINGSEPTLEVA